MVMVILAVTEKWPCCVVRTLTIVVSKPMREWDTPGLISQLVFSFGKVV